MQTLPIPASRPCCAHLPQSGLSFRRLGLLTCSLGLLLGFAAAPTTGFASSDEPVRVKQRIPIEPVVSDHWVGFGLLVDGDTEYAAYYNADRRMTIASRKLGSDKWTTQTLPSVAGYDSHNYIALGADKNGNLHVSGNMHVHQLIYFRTERPGDITSLKQHGRMVGDQELRVTYPKFLRSPDGELIFIYRDGSSGNGADIYNIFDTESGKWKRLLDRPLVEGRNNETGQSMNAYVNGPLLGPDGYYHSTWVWRDTPAAETCHDLSYARSKDLIHWETIDGKPLELPITLADEGTIVDPVPVEGGIINGTGKIGFDKQNRPVIAYHKFDESGATQMYLARYDNGKWTAHKITDWTHRWEPKGGGTLQFDVHHSPLSYDPAIGYYIQMSNTHHGSGIWQVDPQTLQLGEKIDPRRLPGYRPAELNQRTHEDPRMQVRFSNIAEHMGWSQPEGSRHYLRWETLPINKDKPHPGPQPAPSLLELIEVERVD